MTNEYPLHEIHQKKSKNLPLEKKKKKNYGQE